MEMFRTIKTELIALFDERYVVVSSTASATTKVFDAAATSSREKEKRYREFYNTKPPEFNGARDPIVSMMWISDMEGCFYTSACSANLKFKYVHRSSTSRSKKLMDVC